MEIMQRETDDKHGITMPVILKELENYDVTAERKSIYNDFQDMSDKFGIEILKEQIGRDTLYHVGKRQFELAEIKLLIDSIEASRFISNKKSKDLIDKLKSYVSKYEAKQLDRQVFNNDRVKSMNESIYYNVDDIHNAIIQNKKISFNYYKWDIKKELEDKHDGKPVVVSPWALVWADENYYLISYHSSEKKIKHYRVDKMKKMEILDENRDGQEEFEKTDMASYTNATFGMYHGRMECVTIEFKNDLCGIFIDRFGKEIEFRKVDENTSAFKVRVSVSPQFYGWILGLGSGVKLTHPTSVVEDLKKYVEGIMENY